jgi:hypothetical protein
MSDNLPVSIKIICYFRDKREASESNILDSFEDKKEDIKEAMNTLVDRGVLLKEGDMYKQGPHFELIKTKMQEVHKHVTELDTEREIKEWVMRGLLIEVFSLIERSFYTTRPFSSVHLKTLHPDIVFLPLKLLYEVLPFERKEVEKFLLGENKRKFIQILKVLGKDITPSQLYFRSPYWIYTYLTNLSPEENDKVKKSWEAKGSKIYEEDFVLGHYTREVADKARGYLLSKKDLMNGIREKTTNYITKFAEFGTTSKFY